MRYAVSVLSFKPCSRIDTACSSLYRSLARVARLTEFQKSLLCEAKWIVEWDVAKKKQQQTLVYLLLSLDFISKKKKEKVTCHWFQPGIQSANNNPENSYIIYTTYIIITKEHRRHRPWLLKYDRDLYHLSWLNNREVYFIFYSKNWPQTIKGDWPRTNEIPINLIINYYVLIFLTWMGDLNHYLVYRHVSSVYCCLP